MRLRGKGIGSSHYGIGNTGMANPSSAFVEVNEDGSVSVLCGAADMGQGLKTTLAQIVATAIGVPVGRVAVAVADTAATPNAGISSASRQTYISGNACLAAADQVRQALISEAAVLLGVTATNELTIEDGHIVVADEPGRSVALETVAAACRANGVLLVGSGMFNPATVALDPHNGQGEPYGTYAFGAHVAEVEVDTETGEVSVLRVRAAHDVGRVVNPQSAQGQIEGGVAMACGYATMEEVVVESGHAMTKSFVEYSIPTFLDVPAIEAVLVEEPSPTGPFGAKGLGEPPVCCAPAAILNAVYDATGVRMTRLPLSAENVYLALHEAGYRDGRPPADLAARVTPNATD